MVIFVTGAAGFIGFHLVNRLLNEGHDVIGIDSINDYYDVNLKLGRLKVSGIDTAKIKDDQQNTSSLDSFYSFYKMQLEDLSAIDHLFKTHKFDVVVNLAAQAGVRYSIENPHAYISSNMAGFTNILECCKKYPIKHLVYASSSSVYGLNKETIFSTSDRVDHPISVYAATKRSNELLAHAYSHLFNIPTTGLRFFTVYGPWGRPDMAYFLFTKAIIENKPIDVFNNGNMLRDFTYIDDIVEGIRRVIDSPPVKTGEGVMNTDDPSVSTAPFKIYNIGNNTPVKLLDFIDTIEDELGIKAKKNYLPMQKGDVYKTYADVTPLIEELGYRPDTNLKYGVREFTKWYREFYNV
jgi:UDP-glucuronate 4-epimerase